MRVPLASCLAVSCLVAAAAGAADRPNIVFAFADDWGRQASVYAQLEPGGISDAVSTPSFDQLAREGVLFNNAFVNAPSCTPCRSSLLTGQHFWRTGRGAILRGAVWDDSLPSWPLLLRDSGYHIGKSWKVWSPGRPADAPYGGKQHAYQRAGRRINQYSQVATRMVNAGRSAETAQQAILAEVRANFKAFLAHREDDQPFCYWFGPTNVHRKWIKGSGKQLWGIDPDSLKGKLPPYLPDVPAVREDLADYLGEIQAFDAALGVLMDELRQAGEYDNTVLVASGDHGPPGFPHGKCNLYDFGTRVSLAIAGPNVRGGRVVDDFTSLPDLAPTFLAAAGVDAPDVVTASSLWPVLSSDKEGLVDASRTAVFIGRERHVDTARPDNMPYPQRAIRTADHLLIVNFRPERYPLGNPYGLDSDNPPTVRQLTEDTRVTLADDDAGPTKAWIVSRRDDPEWGRYFHQTYDKRPRVELYDLQRDPHQMDNVAEDPQYAEIAQRLEQQLLTELERTGDPRVVDDGRFFETPPMGGPGTEER